LNIWDLELSASILFPEFDAPEFNPDDYGNDFWWSNADKGVSLTVIVNDTAELDMLKKDLTELWYTNWK